MPDEVALAPFNASWREELLSLAWEALARAQREGGPAYYSVLRLRAESPRLSSQALAEELNRRLEPAQQAFTASGVRKLLERARKRYADELWREVGRSLEEPTDECIESELAELELLKYCRPA